MDWNNKTNSIRYKQNGIILIQRYFCVFKCLIYGVHNITCTHINLHSFSHIQTNMSELNLKRTDKLNVLLLCPTLISVLFYSLVCSSLACHVRYIKISLTYKVITRQLLMMDSEPLRRSLNTTTNVLNRGPKELNLEFS